MAHMRRPLTALYIVVMPVSTHVSEGLESIPSSSFEFLLVNEAVLICINLERGLAKGVWVREKIQQ